MDFRIEDHGSLFILVPESDTAREWVEENVDKEHQHWANGIAVEPRYIENLTAGMLAEGLTGTLDGNLISLRDGEVVKAAY